METIEKSITSLGLSEKQAKIYIALLELGLGSAQAIAHKAGIKRPTTYLILDELIDMGIVSLIPRSKKKLYRALHPQLLLEKRKKELKSVEQSLPEIEALMKTVRTGEKPTVMYFEGIDGMHEVLQYKLKEMAGKDIVGFYATSSKEVHKLFNNFDDHSAMIKKLKIHARGIVPYDPVLEYFRTTDHDFGRTMKVLPKEKYSSEVAIEVWDTFIKIHDLDNLQGLIIENPAIAKTMREIFELVWEGLEK